ncbi:hypothetical protein ACP70R_042737 [Stipagrostis hirtigluma subsp. patula]
MYSSYSAAAFALRAVKPSFPTHSPYSYSYLPSHQHHCHRDDAADGYPYHHHQELLQPSPYLSPRFLLDGCLLRHSAHLLLLSARLRPPPPPHPPRCCRRRAAARCCDGGGGASARGDVSWRVEARGRRCCGRGAARSDLGAACRRLEARGCGCGGSGGGRLLGAGCGRRDAPRLVGRAVRQEVWEYEGGEWPHRMCSVECHDDWEEEEDECGRGQWEVSGRLHLGRRRWEDDDADDDDRCRDCRRRKGMGRYYNSEDAYSGQRRERRDLNGGHGSFRDSEHRKREQREYYDDEDELDLRRGRQRWEGRARRDFEFDDAADMRRVGTRRYRDDGREYDKRIERRDFEHDDTADVRRVHRYGEDVRRFDRRTERRDLEIDDDVDVRREHRRHSNNDRRYVTRRQRSEDTDGENVSLLGSRRWHDEELDYDDQDLDEQRNYSRGAAQKSARASALHEYDSKRASSSRNAVDVGRARQEDNSASRVRWHDTISQRTERTSEERDQRLSNERDEYDYDDARYVGVGDVRTGTRDVRVITEDDTNLASSSKNTSILKQSRNVDQKEAVRKDELNKSSQKILEISEVRNNNTERNSRAQRYHQEDIGNYTENRSSTLQSSVNVTSDSRRQVDQHSEVNQHTVAVTESRKNSEKLTDITNDSSHNVSRASHSVTNYNEVNQMDIEDRSTSLQNVTHITKDKKRIINHQVIHETDIDVQNITHVDVSKIHTGDISMSRNSQNHSETRSDMNSTSSMSFIASTRGQNEQFYENKVYASDSAMIRGPHSQLDTGVYDQVHSTSTNIADSTEANDTPKLIPFTVPHTNSSVIASTSQGHVQTRTGGQPQSPSALNSTISVNEQTDLGKIHASDATAVSSSKGLDTRNGNQVYRISSVDRSRESQGMSYQHITQVPSTERNDEVRSKLSDPSQDSRDKMVKLDDTERMVQHNMDLIWQQAVSSTTSDDKDITSLQMESTEEGSSAVNADTTQPAKIIGSNEQEIRSSKPSGSSARQSVKGSMLESAARLEKSSTFHVGQFVDELQKGVTGDTTLTKKNEKSVVEGITSSSSRARMRGPSDEMWDMQSTTSQDTFKTADKDEGFSVDGATNSASQTPKNESALARKVHKSLWYYVADIIRLGWIQRGESHDSSNRSVKKSSSSNSQSTEGWLSSQERDNDGMRKKNGTTKAKDQQLIKSHSGEPESMAASMPEKQNMESSTQCLQIPEVENLAPIGRSELDLFSRSSKDDLHISGERIKQSDVGKSPKGYSIAGFPEDSTSTLVDVMIGHLPEDAAATSSMIETKGSGEINIGKGMLAGTSSVTISTTEAGRSGDGDDWVYDPSVAVTPYQHPQTQAVAPHENTSAAVLEPSVLPMGSSTRFDEKNVVQEGSEVIRAEGKDAELKRRMFQRNKQVPKETFDEWEAAYQHDAKQRKADELFMREALLEAQRAADIWEVPVGAVLVQNGEIIARGCNLVEDLRDSTAHAEIVCIREASNKLKTWRLADTTLYVTLEPCAMCAGAILQARIDTVVWGAPNKLLGADGSWVRLFPGDGQTSTLDSANQSQTAGPIHPFHPKITIRRGVLSTECSEIMQQFFQLRRKKKQRPQSPPRAHHHGHHHPIKFFSKMHNMFGTIFCL